MSDFPNSDRSDLFLAGADVLLFLVEQKRRPSHNGQYVMKTMIEALT
jgi:hypothetical protein